MVNDDITESSGPPTWLREHQSEFVNWLVWLLALVVIAMVIASMTMSFILRIRMGARWEELGSIGEYWGGHLSGIALAVVAVSLLIQRYEFGLQQQELKIQKEEIEETRKSVEREIRATEESLSQARAHFMLEQLRDLGHSLEFVVVRYSEAEMDGRGRERHSGVGRLSLFARHYFDDTDDIEAIVCDFNTLRDFAVMGIALRDVINNMSEATRVWSSTLLGTLFPTTIERLYQDLVRTQDESRARVRSLSISNELKDYLCMLIGEGWEIRYQSSGNNYAAALVRDLVIEKESYSTDGIYCANLEEALAHIVNKKRTAGAHREQNL